MIYPTKKIWDDLTSNFALNKDNLILLDLSVLQQLKHNIQFEASQFNISESEFIKGFQDVIIGIGGINNKAGLIVLNYSRLTQILNPLPQLKYNGLTQYGALKLSYTTSINLGVNIPIQLLNNFTLPQVCKQGIKMYSINIEMSKKQVQFPLLREFIKNHLLGVLTKKILHIYLNLNNPEDLQDFQIQLIQNNYPIEYIMVSSNLYQVIDLKILFPNYQQLDEDQIKQHKIYHYNRYYQKYLNSALMNVLDYYPPIQVSNQNPIQKNQTKFNQILKILMDMSKIKKQKKIFKGGLRVPSALFVNALKQFKGNTDNYYIVHASLQRSIFASLRKVIDGDFKSISKTLEIQK